MAPSSIFMAFVMLLLAAAASAQGLGAAPTPAPDAGAGFSLPASTALVAGSMLLSVLAVIRH